MAPRRRGRFSLLGRLYALVGALIVVSVVITGGMFALRQRVEDSTANLITKVVPAQNDTANLITVYTQQENRVNAFLLTDDPAFLRAYEADQASAAQFHDNVERRLAGDTAVQDMLDQVDAAAQAWRQDSVEPLFARSRSPGPLALSTAERRSEQQRVTALRGELGELRARVDAIEGAERARAAEARGR